MSICDICGRISQQEVSVNSVNSVGRCSVCLVGALLALASGKAERRQVHTLKVLNFVGEYALLALLVHLRQVHPLRKSPRQLVN